MIRKIRTEAKKALGQLVVDLGDASTTLFLAGSGRSGTTWLTEVINADNSLRIMFEPFHSLKIDSVRQWNYRQYLRCENRDRKYMEPARDILSGNIRDPWIDQFNRKHVARKRLIKDIRANLLLKWIKHNFPEIPIVLVLRHPCAVANSKIKLGWGTHLGEFLVQDELLADFLHPFKKQIEGAKDLFDRHIFMWCIENYVPLRQFEAGEILLLFYENLCLNPRDEIESLFSFIGGDMPSNCLGKSGKASAVSRKESAINSGADLISSWRSNIGESQIRRAGEILTLFGLERIYSEGGCPLVGADEALNSFSS